MTTKEELLEEIAFLIKYDGTKTEIDPSVLEFLELSELNGIAERLRKRKTDIKQTVEEEREWLEQFKKEK